eukprot:800877-Prorocentrum_minimum.AAC.1
MPGGRPRLLLYSALATASVWDGMSVEDAPALADDAGDRVQWERHYSQLSPRQRRKAVKKGGSRITLSAL